MNLTRGLRVTVPVLALLLACSAAFAQSSSGNPIKRVMLISIDGMHSIDFANCSAGISTINGGKPYCPYLARLSNHGVHYVQALTPRPSDSFPGLTALITGGTPRSAGMYYDVNYDCKLSPPYTTTPYGILGGPSLCPSVIAPRSGSMKKLTSTIRNLMPGN